MKRNKTNRVLSIVIALLVVLSLTACGSDSKKSESAGETSTERITLNLTMHDPVESRVGQEISRWADEVKEKTNGGLTIQVHGSGSLAGSTDAYDAVKNGQADIAWIFTMFNPEQFPLTEVITIPMLGITHPAQTAEVLWDLYEQTPELQDELSSVKVLEMYGNPLNFIATSKKPVKTLDDLKGMSIRCLAGGMTEVMKAWGANPILVGAGDAYDAVQKGNIEGTIWEWQGIEAFKLYEVLNYYTDMPVYEGVFILAMNNEKWDSLPEEYKKVIDETTQREASVAFGEYFQNAALDSKKAVLSAGGEEIIPAPEEVAKFKAIADQYASTWVEKVSKDGFDGQAYLEKTLELAEKHKYPE